MKLIDLIKLWLLGLGMPLTVLDNERVKWELAQNPVDGVGLLQALQMTDCSAPLFEPRYQLELITMVNSNGQEMVTFGDTVEREPVNVPCVAGRIEEPFTDLFFP